MTNSTNNPPDAGSLESGAEEPVDTGSAVIEDMPPPMPVIRRLDTRAPLSWLQRGWQDMRDTRFKGCFYGLIFVLMGYAIVWVYATKWQLTMGLVGGFFLMGPFLCTGIYDLSRQQEKYGKASLIKSLTCWSRNLSGLAFFAIILTFAMIVWARVSLILFALVSTTSFPTVKGVLSMIFTIDNPQFLALWAGVGFIFASIVFAVGVIAAPMMLDRKSDTFMAIFSSVRSLQTNPRPLYLWAFLVVVIIGLSLAAGFIPLLITAPIIGHATWHAYRDLVEPEPASWVFGYTEQQISSFGLTFGVAGFMLYMLFIVWNLAKESKAGKVGTIVLFCVLGFGMLGFVAKSFIQRILDI